jgi:transposase
LNSKLHAVCDGEGRPLVMLLSEGHAASMPKIICIYCIFRPFIASGKAAVIFATAS